uniref:Ribosomal protein S10 n=1 Tax=Taxus cuspidata TaxID=99806 RepID=A0A6B9XP10_TAXCU|nr:ribosomal protein S10 [Taxus cuspidata]
MSSAESKADNTHPAQKQKHRQEGKGEGAAPSPIGDAKIRVLVKSFSKKYLNHPCFQDFRKVGLPRRRVLYTVLRSPHIDKKSREQFEMRVYKQLLEKETDVNELAKKFFWFKRMHFFGAQYEFIFNYKTRLDMTRVHATSSILQTDTSSKKVNSNCQLLKRSGISLGTLNL